MLVHLLLQPVSRLGRRYVREQLVQVTFIDYVNYLLTSTYMICIYFSFLFKLLAAVVCVPATAWFPPAYPVCVGASVAVSCAGVVASCICALLAPTP